MEREETGGLGMMPVYGEPQMDCSPQQRKRWIREYRQEYELAVKIMRLIEKELESDPNFNPCRVRAFCEMMID